MADKNQGHEEEQSWGIDKRIPLTLVFIVVMQTCGFIWSASTLSHDVQNLHKTTNRLEAQITNLNEKYERYQVLFYTREEANREHARFESEMSQLEDRIQYLERTSNKP
jgi:exonuclease VII small subunit